MFFTHYLSKMNVANYLKQQWSRDYGLEHITGKYNESRLGSENSECVGSTGITASVIPDIHTFAFTDYISGLDKSQRISYEKAP